MTCRFHLRRALKHSVVAHGAARGWGAVHPKVIRLVFHAGDCSVAYQDLVDERLYGSYDVGYLSTH